MKTDELISILMPTYNVEQYVEEAVRSVLYQTYTNFELIIVDDCSSDRTFEILTKLSEEDSRIKLYRNDENKKICRTLNRALSYAKGIYIGRMDGDDISTYNRLEILKDYLDNNVDIDLVGSNMITIDESGNQISQKKYIQTDKYIKIGNGYQPCVAHIWLARRRVYEELKGYRDVPFVEDWDFLLRGQNKKFKYANVDENIYKCRLRNGNTASSNGLKQRKAGQYVLNLYKKEKKSEKDEFNEIEYLEAISSTLKEEQNYIKASNYLNKAVHNKNNIAKLTIYIFLGAFYSKYVSKYIYSSFMVRINLIKDKIWGK